MKRGCLWGVVLATCCFANSPDVPNGGLYESPRWKEATQRPYNRFVIDGEHLILVPQQFYGFPGQTRIWPDPPGILEPHLSQTPALGGWKDRIYLAMGNEVGDPLFQELVSQPGLRNRTPFWSASLWQSLTQRWSTGLLWDQNDHASSTTESSRRSLLTSEPGESESWFGGNLPAKSLLSSFGFYRYSHHFHLFGWSGGRYWGLSPVSRQPYPWQGNRFQSLHSLTLSPNETIGIELKAESWDSFASYRYTPFRHQTAGASLHFFRTPSVSEKQRGHFHSHLVELGVDWGNRNLAGYSQRRENPFVPYRFEGEKGWRFHPNLKGATKGSWINRLARQKGEISIRFTWIPWGLTLETMGYWQKAPLLHGQIEHEVGTPPGDQLVTHLKPWGGWGGSLSQTQKLGWGNLSWFGRIAREEQLPIFSPRGHSSPLFRTGHYQNLPHPTHHGSFELAWQEASLWLGAITLSLGTREFWDNRELLEFLPARRWSRLTYQIAFPSQLTMRWESTWSSSKTSRDAGSPLVVAAGWEHHLSARQRLFHDRLMLHYAAHHFLGQEQLETRWGNPVRFRILIGIEAFW